MPFPPDLIDTAGRPYSRRSVIVAMGVNTLAASLGSAWYAMTYTMPLILFMQAIGASGLVIGLVSTIRMVAISAQIPAALITEHLGRANRSGRGPRCRTGCSGLRLRRWPSGARRRGGGFR